MDREISKQKKVKEKTPRQTTARFTTDECKVILMSMNYSVNREVFLHEGGGIIQEAGRIINKLRDRINKERIKKNKVLEETKNEI